MLDGHPPQKYIWETTCVSTLFSWPQWQHTVISWPLLISLYGSLGVGRAAADPETEAATNQLPARIQLTLVDDQTIHYATFQSHNQKVVEHEGQVYMTHLRACNVEYTDQLWRLSCSRDGGVRFETLCEESAATNPPLLEVDELGNLYLLRVDFVSHDAYLDRWPRGAADRAQARSTTRIPNAAAGKYAAMIDPNRQLIYFFSHNNTFHRLRLDGTLVDSRNLLTAGPHGLLQYPLLSLDPHGKLHLAWTTQKHGEYLYWDIHHAWSGDGGETFRSWSASESVPTAELTLPIIADDTGPTCASAWMMSSRHTWLSSSLATQNHWHGAVPGESNPPRQHYVRYRLSTGQRELDRQPELLVSPSSCRVWMAFWWRTGGGRASTWWATTMGTLPAWSAMMGSTRATMRARATIRPVFDRRLSLTAAMTRSWDRSPTKLAPGNYRSPVPSLLFSYLGKPVNQWSADNRGRATSQPPDQRRAVAEAGLPPRRVGYEPLTIHAKDH